MPVSEKQRAAACSDLRRVQRGGEARTFREAPLKVLNDFCHGPLEARKGGKVPKRRKRARRY